VSRPNNGRDPEFVSDSAKEASSDEFGQGVAVKSSFFVTLFRIPPTSGILKREIPPKRS